MRVTSILMQPLCPAQAGKVLDFLAEAAGHSEELIRDPDFLEVQKYSIDRKRLLQLYVDKVDDDNDDQ